MEEEHLAQTLPANALSLDSPEPDLDRVDQAMVQDAWK